MGSTIPPRLGDRGRRNEMNDALKAFAEATNNEVYETGLDPDGEALGWMVGAVETHETIENFVEASNSYNECTAPKFGTLAGFAFVAFKRAQPRKGDERRSLSVIDLGDVRYAIDCDLTVFL